MAGRQPKLDPARVGLGLVDVAYGVVLARIFEPTALGWERIGAAGWSQLAVAAVAVVLSWVGLHNNRGEYPSWKLTFVNISLVQYLLSVAVLAAYWGLVVTTEDLPAARGLHSQARSAVPEAVLITVIFAAYLLWDSLEILIYSRPKYRTVLQRPPIAKKYPLARLKKRAEALRNVTAAFFGLSMIALLAILTIDPTGAWTVVLIDLGFIVGLFAYRLVQQVKSP